jgi:hypothetical protein
MKKFVGGILIVIGIIIAIPVGLRVMHLMSHLIQIMFDPIEKPPGYSITYIAATIVLSSLMIVAFRYGTKFWKGEEKQDDATNNIDSSMDES